MNVKIAPRLARTAGSRIRKTLLRATRRLRSQRIRHTAHLSARQQHLPRLRQVPVRETQSGHHRPRPLSRRGAGQRTLFFGERRYSLSPVVAEHLSGDIDRHRYARSFDRQSRPVGRTGRPAAQFGTDRAGPSGRFARRTRVGNLHRCRRPCHRRAQNGDRLHALGQLRPAQRRDRQPAEQLHTESRPPLSAFGLPRILRLPALLAGQRISPEPRKRADRLVAAQDYHGFRISAASARGDSASISVKFALHAVYSYFGCAVDTPLGKMQTSLLLPSLIRIFDFVEDTLVRQCSNKFDIALTYSYLCLRINS